MASTRSKFLRYHSWRPFPARLTLGEWDHLWACGVPRKVRFVSLYTDIQVKAIKDGGQTGCSYNAITTD